VRDAYKKIYQTEGIGGYYRGVFPSMVRSSIINATELTSFD